MPAMGDADQLAMADGTDADRVVIDVHSHAFPRPLLDFLAARGYADLSRMKEGALQLEMAVSGVPSGSRIPLPVEQYDPVERLRCMTAASVDVQLVSAPPFVFGSMSDDANLVLDLARRSNDALAEYVAVDNTRMAALGTVPIGLPGAAEEARRCLDSLGMVGLTTGTYGGGCELDDPINMPFWTFISERKAFCLIHPSRSSSPERLRDYYLVQLLGYPTETALAATRLIFGGILDRLAPVLCLAHGGGCLVGLGPRLDVGWHRKREAHTSEQAPTEYLERFTFDTAMFDATAMSRLVKDVGSDNILLGTDIPFELADNDAVARIMEMKLEGDRVNAILGGNVRRLIPELDVICAKYSQSLR